MDQGKWMGPYYNCGFLRSVDLDEPWHNYQSEVLNVK